MVTIRQHGDGGVLFDIVDFLADIDRFVRPDAWHVTIDECMGHRALELERLTKGGRRMSDREFRTHYRGIRQTIDGRFLGLRRRKRVFWLEAVDSSYWEVTGPTAFESHMLAKYGGYVSAFR